MDPLTQGLLGAAAAQALAGGRLRHAWLIGAGAGMAADLDVLVRSASDPLLAIEHHRGFTHALAFIPVGGALTALPWLAARGRRRQWKDVLLAATAAYATHGLLDACTTYGTQLFWPFSAHRVAWSWISILDPAFTLALLVGVAWSARIRGVRPAVAALAFCALYLAAGAAQRGRALAAQERIAAARGHEVARAEAFPTLGNHLVWRSLYQSGDSLYADRIRVAWGSAPRWSAGSAVAVVREGDVEAAREDRRAARDFRRFRWFSDGWVARAPNDPEVIGDARYSLRTDSFEPVWGIRFHPGAAVPTEWVSRTRERSLELGELWAEVAGTDPGYRPLPRTATTGRGKPRSRPGGPSDPGRGRTPPARPGRAT